jgi:uncharacterized protein YajQ (UPF0234 family)
VPSFDIVSEVDMHEVTNAVDQANRELLKRFDFKNTKARFDLEGDQVTLCAPNEFQVKQMFDILLDRFAARRLDTRSLLTSPPQSNVSETSQLVTVRRGIDVDLARQIVKMIKKEKLKVQASIQGDKVRVSGKKKDDLQQVIGMLKDAKIDMPLQYQNYRD